MSGCWALKLVGIFPQTTLTEPSTVHKAESAADLSLKRQGSGRFSCLSIGRKAAGASAKSNFPNKRHQNFWAPNSRDPVCFVVRWRCYCTRGASRTDPGWLSTVIISPSFQPYTTLLKSLQRVKHSHGMLADCLYGIVQLIGFLLGLISLRQQQPRRSSCVRSTR